MGRGMGDGGGGFVFVRFCLVCCWWVAFGGFFFFFWGGGGGVVPCWVLFVVFLSFSLVFVCFCFKTRYD